MIMKRMTIDPEDIAYYEIEYTMGEVTHIASCRVESLGEYIKELGMRGGVVITITAKGADYVV